LIHFYKRIRSKNGRELEHLINEGAWNRKLSTYCDKCNCPVTQEAYAKIATKIISWFTSTIYIHEKN